LKNPENDIDKRAVAKENMRYQSYDIYNDQSYGYGAYRNYENFRLGIFAISNAKPTVGMNIRYFISNSDNKVTFIIH